MSELLDTLYKIQEEQRYNDGKGDKFVQFGTMPYATKFCEVDLNSRTIEAPEYLSVAKDHKAENIYFRIDRYCDYMDLATTTCVVQYTNAFGSGIYAVPYFDIETGRGNAQDGTTDKIIIPWCLDGRASAADGEIQFALKFYRIDRDGTKYLYNLNTKPATSKILYGMNIDSEEMGEQFDLSVPAYLELKSLITDVSKKDTYWIEYK